ncbi:histone-fold-containing protein [Aureobasidium namibiae CBS 147.97]|uniref:Histone H2B n=1 Tax=Aureobasidium namibiae CBS 147.97 TaxID=1043004 RepID=A0A074WGA2_9PEZI
MPPKIAKKGTNSQIKQAIANTQAEPTAEIQADADTQVDDDVPSSSANSNTVNDALDSTADGAAASAVDTTHTSADEAENNNPAGKKPAGKKVAATTGTKDGEGKKKRRRKTDFSNFSIYIFRVLKQIHAENGISKNAMQIMNDFIKDLFTRIAELACDLCKKLKKATLQAHEIQTAIKLILPGGLADHAQGEGAKALRNFNRHTQQGLR